MLDTVIKLMGCRYKRQSVPAICNRFADFICNFVNGWLCCFMQIDDEGKFFCSHWSAVYQLSVVTSDEYVKYWKHAPRDRWFSLMRLVVGLTHQKVTVAEVQKVTV